MKSNYRDPRYRHLFTQDLKSTLTKSKNLDLHLYLIEYDDPDDIPFNAIAEVTGTEPNKIRALMRSVKDEKTYLGLLEIGVSSEDIPYWYRRPEFIRKITKAKAKIVEDEKVQRPTKISRVFNPLEGLNLPPTFRPTQREDGETNGYHVEDYDNERYMSPTQEAMWRASLKALHDDEREREEERRKEERERRPLTPEERKTYVDAKILCQEVKNKRHIEEYLICKTNIDFKAASDRAIFEKDLEASLQLFGDTMANVAHMLYDMRPPPPSTKIDPYVPPNNDDHHQKLREFNIYLDDERLAGFRAIAELGKDIQEMNRRAKRDRHWRFHASNEYAMKHAFRA